MTEVELLDYFNEHIYYEMGMIKFTGQRLMQEDSPLIWKAMFSAFNVSARNLECFLRNKGTNNDMRLLDYAAYRKSAGKISNEQIVNVLNDLHAQCLHLGKKRSERVEKKINIDGVRKVSDWVITNMNDVFETLHDGFRTKLRREWDDLLKSDTTLRVGLEGPSTSSSFLMVESGVGPTGTGDFTKRS